jgi:hypothetical protein
VGGLGGLHVLIMPEREDGKGECTHTLLIGKATQPEAGEDGR